MKGIFITYVPTEKDTTGVGKKIRGQIQAFNKNDLYCSEITMYHSTSKLMRLLYKFPFYNGAPIWKWDTCFEQIDYLYMRRPLVVSGYMIKFLKRIKKRNPFVKIIYEIPTYPYDKELYSFKFRHLLIWKDRFNRKKLHDVVDRIVTLTDDKIIFHTPTLKILNGVDLKENSVKKISRNNDETIQICAVAIFKEWHGYERVLYGLAQYYHNGGTRNIICHFVGDGSELAFYKKIVDEKQLNEHVKFYGMLKDQELISIYNQCRLSLESFGSYKKNIKISCGLKSREMLARGLPLIAGNHVDLFMDRDFPYFLEFPNNDSIIDFQKIIDFYDRIYTTESEEVVIQKIRSFAENHVDIEAGMKTVIEYIKYG